MRGPVIPPDRQYRAAASRAAGPGKSPGPPRPAAGLRESRLGGPDAGADPAARTAPGRPIRVRGPVPGDRGDPRRPLGHIPRGREEGGGDERGSISSNPGRRASAVQRPRRNSGRLGSGPALLADGVPPCPTVRPSNSSVTVCRFPLHRSFVERFLNGKKDLYPSRLLFFEEEEARRIAGNLLLFGWAEDVRRLGPAELRDRRASDGCGSVGVRRPRGWIADRRVTGRPGGNRARTAGRRYRGATAAAARTSSPPATGGPRRSA